MLDVLRFIFSCCDDVRIIYFNLITSFIMFINRSYINEEIVLFHRPNWKEIHYKEATFNSRKMNIKFPSIQPFSFKIGCNEKKLKGCLQTQRKYFGNRFPPYLSPWPRVNGVWIFIKILNSNSPASFSHSLIELLPKLFAKIIEVKPGISKHSLHPIPD